MTAETTRRGRPKGTGKDDASIIEEIAARIAADPSLRPTTVIKSLGIADTSTVRRLRDKYNSVENARPTQAAGGNATPVAPPARSIAAAHSMGPKLVEELPASSPSRKKARAASASPLTPGGGAQGRPAARTQASIVTEMQSAFATMLQAQVRIGTAMVRTSPLGVMIHQQIVMTNLMLGTIHAQRTLWNSFIAPSQSGSTNKTPREPK